MDRAFMLYAMEQEGDLPTRQGKINNFINQLSAAADNKDPYVQERIRNMTGIDDLMLTPDEIQYIEDNVRWNENG
jgi:hypothetical protein